MRGSVSSGDRVSYLQLMASTIQSQLEEAHDLWDSFAHAPCGGAELGLMVAERFITCIDGMLWAEQGLGSQQALPQFSDMAHAADMAIEQLEEAAAKLESAIKEGYLAARAPLEVNPPTAAISQKRPPPVNFEAERKAAQSLDEQHCERELALSVAKAPRAKTAALSASGGPDHG